MMPEEPDDLVEMGRVIGAFGVRGQLKVEPFAGPDSHLSRLKRLWLKRPDKTLDCSVMSCKLHADTLILSLEGFADRDLAVAWKGASVCASRAQFPETDANEVYWVDLLGCSVYGRADAFLGTVSAVDDHGGGPFLKVTSQAGAAERLIPYVAQYITDVNLAEQRISADWDPDWD